MTYEFNVRYTPNVWGERDDRWGRPIRYICLHSTRGGDEDAGRHGLAREYFATIFWFRSQQSNASTEFLVGKDRPVVAFVNSGERSGKEHYVNVNDWREVFDAVARYGHWSLGIGSRDPALSTINIEMVQEFIHDEFDPEVLETTAQLVADLCKYFGVKPQRVRPRLDTYATSGIYGHEDINAGKSDPGPEFPWADFIARVNDILTPAKQPPELGAVRELLAKADNALGLANQQVVTARTYTARAQEALEQVD